MTRSPNKDIDKISYIELEITLCLFQSILSTEVLSALLILNSVGECTTWLIKIQCHPVWVCDIDLPGFVQSI